MVQNDEVSEWLLPAAIPFESLKGRDLEECVYWLLDAMGAKDLEWRTGGSGGGAPDGGRDLEAVFYTPMSDGEIEAQKWWIECKGRAATVEPDEVKSAVINAMAVKGLDYVVIVTNTQFSNPTRDWVKTWQAAHSNPRVKLWDGTQLERYLSRHPDVVLRLFSQALSIDGRIKAFSSRFWNKLEYVATKTLVDVWKVRTELSFEPAEMFALIANEIAGGNVAHRPWAATLDAIAVKSVLAVGMVNVPYLLFRSLRAGADQTILFRTFAYLILAALDESTPDDVAEVISISVSRDDNSPVPEEVQDIILVPILNQLLNEMQDLCSSNCRRMMSIDRRTLRTGEDEIDQYWLRLEPEGVDEPEEERRFLQLEKLDEPCAVGFPVDTDHGCPLFHFEPHAKTVEDLLVIIKKVAAFRKSEAREKRAASKVRVEQLRARPIVPLD
jgi:hypothetical protein